MKIEQVVRIYNAEDNRGTGYLIKDNLILTAYHIVKSQDNTLAETSKLTVLFISDLDNSNIELLQKKVFICWFDEKLDLALLNFVEIPNSPVIEASRFGKILNRLEYPVIGYGFPSFARINTAINYTNVTGKLSGLGAERANRLRLIVNGPIPRVIENTGWAGVSGTALFYLNFLVGIILEVHPKFDENVLLVMPISNAFKNPDFFRFIDYKTCEEVELAFDTLEKKRSKQIQGGTVDVTVRLSSNELYIDATASARITGHGVRANFVVQLKDHEGEKIFDREYKIPTAGGEGDITTNPTQNVFEKIQINRDKAIKTHFIEIFISERNQPSNSDIILNEARQEAQKLTEEAQRLLNNAQQEAQRVINDAQQEAQRVINNAQQEAQRVINDAQQKARMLMDRLGF